MSLLPNELEEMLGTKEEFEKCQCEECDYKEDCFSKLPLVNIVDEDLDEKLEGEYQEEMRDSLED